MVFETAAADIFAPERTVQSQPADGTGDVVGAAQNATVDQDARADTGTDREEDCVTAAFGDAAPCLAQNIGSPVAIDNDLDTLVWQRSQDFAAQWVILPTGDVRRPNFACLGITDARDRDADGADAKSFGAGGGQQALKFLANQCSYRSALTAFQQHDALPDNLPVAGEEGTGKLGAAQVDSNDGGVGHDSNHQRRKSWAAESAKRRPSRVSWNRSERMRPLPCSAN